MYRYAVPFAYYRQEIDSNKLRLAGRWLRNQVLNSYPSETHGLWYLFHSYSKGERIPFAILFIEFISGYLENIYIKVIKRNAEYHLGLENIKMEDRKQRNNQILYSTIFFFYYLYFHCTKQLRKSWSQCKSFISISELHYYLIPKHPDKAKNRFDSRLSKASKR